MILSTLETAPAHLFATVSPAVHQGKGSREGRGTADREGVFAERKRILKFFSENFHREHHELTAI